MAWVRIEDGVTEHRKHLCAGAAACWLWVCGIAYCQRQLSDGFIPTAAVPLLGVVKGAKTLAERLVTVGLFDRVEGGYRVHDYHDYNATRAEAMAQQHARQEQRRQAGIASGRSRRVQRDVNEPVERTLNPIPSHPIPSHPEEQKKSSNNGRSRHPIFSGQRFVVFDWMLEDMGRTLGSHTEAFDLHTWFFDLDAHAVKEALVLPKGEQWPWLQRALLAEVAKRGLPIAAAPQKNRLPVKGLRENADEAL